MAAWPGSSSGMAGRMRSNRMTRHAGLRPLACRGWPRMYHHVPTTARGHGPRRHPRPSRLAARRGDARQSAPASTSSMSMPATTTCRSSSCRRAQPAHRRIWRQPREPGAPAARDDRGHARTPWATRCAVAVRLRSTSCTGPPASPPTARAARSWPCWRELPDLWDVNVAGSLGNDCEVGALQRRGLPGDRRSPS